MPSNKPLKEDDECKLFVKWLRLNRYKFTHIWNEAGQRGTRNIIIMMMRKKALWVSSWFPDYFIVLKRKAILLVEMKKEKGKKWGLNGSTISPEQIDWIDTLNDVENVSAVIAHWHREAIEKVEEFEQM